mmetsp:Transcript_39770/g.62210  ORF Transcript_39770/g.62210 Transcript_39770/m.62210 type:complete len:129 (-) Transcript_39770:344-730(-)
MATTKQKGDGPVNRKKNSKRSSKKANNHGKSSRVKGRRKSSMKASGGEDDSGGSRMVLRKRSSRLKSKKPSEAELIIPLKLRERYEEEGVKFCFTVQSAKNPQNPPPLHQVPITEQEISAFEKMTSLF